MRLVSKMNTVQRRRSSQYHDKPDIFGDKGGRLNIILKISVIIYRSLRLITIMFEVILIVCFRHTILGLDVSVFLLKAIGEYIRLLYRSFIPRPLRDVAGRTLVLFSFFLIVRILFRRSCARNRSWSWYWQGGGTADGKFGGHSYLY